MQSFRSCRNYEVVTTASLSGARQSEANVLVLELAELLLDKNRPSPVYDRRYLGRVLGELLRAADGETRREALHRLEAGVGSDRGDREAPHPNRRGVGTPTVSYQARHDREPSFAPTQEPSGPARAAPLLAGWKTVVVLAALLLLAAATLALANQDTSDGERAEATASAAVADIDAPPSKGAGSNDVAPPEFDVARISRDGVGVLAGRAMPKSSVRLLADGEPWASVEADARGEWALILDRPLKAGLSALVLETQVGDDRLRSPNTLVIMRPGHENGRGATEADFAGGPDVLAILTPQAGSQASRVLQKPNASTSPSSADLPRVETVDFDTAGRSVVTGRAPANHRVALRLNGETIAQLRADAQGRWVFALEDRLSTGAYRLAVETIDEKSRTLARNSQSFEVGDLVAPPPTGRGIALEMREAFWAMVRTSAGMEQRYTLVFREHAGPLLDAASAAGMR